MKTYYTLFCVFIFAVSTDLNNFLSLSFGTSGLLSPIFIVLLLVFLFYSIKYNLKLDKYTKLLIFLFIVWFSYGLILNIGKPEGFEVTFERFRYYLPSVLYLYAVSLTFNKFFQEGKMLNLIRMLSIALILNSAIIALSSLGYVLPLSNLDSEEDRLGGLFESVNQAGIVSSFAQAFCLFFVFSEQKKSRKIIYFSLYLISLSAAIFTFSKGAFLYSIIVLLIFIYFQTFRSKERKLTAKISQIAIIAVFFVVGFLVFQGVFSEREYSRNQEQRIDQFERLLRGEINEETTTNRSRIGSVAFKLIEEDFFMGRGIGTFHRIEELEGLGTHDTYLLILGEIGVLGLFILVCYYLKLWWSSYKIKINEYSFICISLISILILASLVSHNILYVKLYIVLFSFLNAMNTYLNRKALTGE